MRKLKIKDIGQVVSGSTPKTNVDSYWGGEIPWVTPKELSSLSSQYLNDSVEKITKEGYNSCSTTLLPKNSVLFSCRAPIGLVAINTIPVCTNQGFKSVIPNKNVSSLYLFYALKFFRKRLDSLGNGATFRELSKRTFEEFEIPIPELEEQIHIANILSKAETLVGKRKESLLLLDELLKSTFLEMFGDPVRNEKGWESIQLSEACLKIGSGATPKGGKESYHNEGISLIRSLNVHNDEFVYKNLAFIDDKQAYELKNVIVEEKDVLLNITGASVARCCIVPKNILPARVNQHVSILRPDGKILNPIFLSKMFTSKGYQANLIRVSKSKGATREAITKEEIEQMKVIAPPIKTQIKFSHIVEKTEALKIQYQSSIQELENLFGSFSQKAFKGELKLGIDETFSNRK